MRMKSSFVVLCVAILAPLQALAFSQADAEALSKNATSTVAKFQGDVTDSGPLIHDAKGILVCPTITKGGFIAGLESGTCALQVEGKTVNYFRTSSAKFGLLAGIQSFSMMLVFNDQAALDKFRAGDRKFEVGADVSVAVISVGGSGKLDTTNIKKEIVGFVFGEKGLMADASIEGTTFKKLQVEE